MTAELHAEDVNTTTCVTIPFRSVPGPGHGLVQKCGFQPLKTQLSDLWGAKTNCHDNQRGSKYKITEKFYI